MASSSSPGKFFFIGSVLWLLVLATFSLGVYVYAAKKWPYPLIAEIESFIAGDEEETVTLVEKVRNDLQFKPERHLVSNERKDLRSGRYAAVENVPFRSRRSNPLVFVSENAPAGYRLIYGALDTEDSFHGALLLDAGGEVVHRWNVSQQDVDWNHRPDNNVFPHGIEVSPDGSIVVAFDAGTSLTRYDACGEIVWRVKGNFHHSVAFDNDDTVWAWGKPGMDKGYHMDLTKVSYRSGEVITTFPLQAVVDANPDIDIFHIRQIDGNEGSRWAHDKWHPNDIEPLPSAWADRYPGFDAGDLLVSLRSPDLIFVIDPETLRVKWWRQGLARRPHDPDWNSKGTITIFNNNMHRGYSNIMEIDPVTYEHEIIVDGEDYDFYTWHQGKHQMLENGNLLVASPEQGWVFEVDGDNGEIVFEFLNFYGGGKEFIRVSEARYLPLDFFEEFPLCQ